MVYMLPLITSLLANPMEPQFLYCYSPTNPNYIVTAKYLVTAQPTLTRYFITAQPTPNQYFVTAQPTPTPYFVTAQQTPTQYFITSHDIDFATSKQGFC